MDPIQILTNQTYKVALSIAPTDVGAEMGDG